MTREPRRNPEVSLRVTIYNKKAGVFRHRLKNSGPATLFETQRETLSACRGVISNLWVMNSHLNSVCMQGGQDFVGPSGPR